MEPLIITLLVLNLVAVAALVVAWMRSSARGGESERLQSLIGEKARIESDLDNERKSGAEKLALLTDAEARLKIEFENLSQKIFDEKGRAISEQNRERMEGLLAPLRTQLEGFRARVDEVHRDDTASHASIIGQVLKLQETTNRVSADANRLAEAIKANPQQQGAWGELVIERILEASGLQRDVGYFVQEGIRTEDGSLQKLDFRVELPGNRCAIVDSKVSLVAFERYCSAADDRSRKEALKEHLASVRSHVAGLKEKQYERLLGDRTLDFVILCVPLEPAFQLALKEDVELIQDLSGGNVVITGPTTLMITLRMIAQIWRRENENRNAQKIADCAGRLYDQVALALESLIETGTRLSRVRESFDEAMGRMQDGRGNVVKKIEELRTLGAKASRQLPEASSAPQG